MNNWLDKLERKFSRYAIPNLMTYIILYYNIICSRICAESDQSDVL